MDRCPRVAVVEDDPILVDILARALRNAGFDATPYQNGESFVQALAAGETPEVVVLDVRLPDRNGLELLEHLGSAVPTCRVVMMTAYRTFEAVLGSLRMGAVEFLLKPVTATEVVEAVQRSLRMRRAGDEVREKQASFLLREPVGSVESHLAETMGPSATVTGIARFVRKAADATVPVLLTGETGTGKEVVARAIHDGGPRAHGEFVTLNCGAIPEGLVEAELFGHERGSFTGASERRTGLIEEADESTLFLDEIGDLPVGSQVKLLRVLQEGEVRRVGSSRPQRVDVRVIAATNRDLEAEVAAGRFRQDLFYRLGVLKLRLPPLRERREDIPHLVERFLRLYAKGEEDGIPVLAARTLAALKRYPWPGNVRELENEIARIVTMVEEESVSLDDLSPEIRAIQQLRGAGGLRAALDLQERKMIVSCLEETGWNKAEAARLLGMSRQNLYQRMDTHDIPRRPPGR